nr:uncharacterized protein LOC111417767 [Onthophagus taurus]
MSATGSVSVSDENALRGLPLLLIDHVATYWQGIKQTIKSWEDAIDARYVPRTAKVPRFTNKVLPPYREEMQIDMIYGLLRRKIRKHVSRKSVKSFTDLIEYSRSAEQSLACKDDLKDKMNAKDKDNSARKKVKCAYCKIYGHLLADCESLKRKTEKKGTMSPSTTNAASNFSKPTISCYVCVLKGQACLDTGAVRSIIDKTLCENIKDKVTFTKENIVVK